MNVEARERFFRAIAERIDVERVEEVHVFPAIRQGGLESGVAVLTLRPLPAEGEVVERPGAAEDAGTQEHVEGGDAMDVAESVDATAEGDASAPAPDAALDEDVSVVDDIASAEEELAESLPTPPPPRRFTVLRAHYRLQLKGRDRGKWEVAVVEEADAPAATVDEVVRGVHERAGGWSVEGPERLTGDEFRAALVEERWSATR